MNSAIRQTVRQRSIVPLTLCALLLTACGSDNKPTAEPRFDEVVEHPGAALMGVAARADGAVFIAGAQTDPQQPGTLLRLDGDAWRLVEHDNVHPLWWVHTFDDGPTFVSGGGATWLKVTDQPAGGETVERLDTPPFFGNTLYGTWGARPDDMWAVGGFAGRAGVVWRYDGAQVTEVALPTDVLPRSADGEVPALFKVDGTAADDVWIVGGAGAVLHFDGSEWQRFESGTEAALFTVAVDEDHVWIVGGEGAGVVLRGDRKALIAGTASFEDVTPQDAPLIQGLCLDDASGDVLIAGASGFAAVLDADDKAGSKAAGAWRSVDLGFDDLPQSVHAVTVMPGAGSVATKVFGVGGGVLSPTLADGVACAGSLDGKHADVPTWTAPPPPAEDPALKLCPDDRIDIAPNASIARRWIEINLDAIRRDIPHPPVHARNLLHVSMAMYDAWATYQATGLDAAPRMNVYDQRHTAASDADIDTAISYAAYRVLTHRYAKAVKPERSLDCMGKFMGALGLDPADEHTDGDDPIAVGNRIGAAVVARFANDGANEANGYVDTTGWEPTNPVAVVDGVGTNVEDPNTWQQLNLGTAETQNGIVLDDAVQPYIGAHWREVEAFALQKDPTTGLYSPQRYMQGFDHYPKATDPEMADWVIEVIERTAWLDAFDGELMDIGPGGLGNNPLGTNDGSGHDLNPVTGQPYAENLVPRSDFGRVIAEVWADGPQSETPPGHWIKLANEVSDKMAARGDAFIPFGGDEAPSRLAWDVGIYLTVAGAVHDAAMSAWELKRDSLSARPISLIRWMAANGQRTDKTRASYHEHGLPLVPGLVEEITAESAAEGERHFHLRWYIGEIAVRAWPGEPGDRDNDTTRVQWMRALDWIPYQRRTFVTPAFPGYTSGHSTFSRAGAEAMARYTGSEFFPGGIHGWTAKASEYLVFEDGPSVEVNLQWATYADAADQAGQSRLWGGIHVWPDDQVGRINGAAIGQGAADKVVGLLLP